MARKTMTKEVTKTNVKVAKMQLVDGKIDTKELPDELLIGNVSMEKAQKLLNKKYGEPVTVLQVSPETQVYEMAVEEFIKHASIKQKEEDTPKQEVAQSTKK